MRAGGSVPILSYLILPTVVTRNSRLLLYLLTLPIHTYFPLTLASTFPPCGCKCVTEPCNRPALGARLHSTLIFFSSSILYFLWDRKACNVCDQTRPPFRFDLFVLSLFSTGSNFTLSKGNKPHANTNTPCFIGSKTIHQHIRRGELQVPDTPRHHIVWQTRIGSLESFNPETGPRRYTIFQLACNQSSRVLLLLFPIRPLVVQVVSLPIFPPVPRFTVHLSNIFTT